MTKTFYLVLTGEVREVNPCSRTYHKDLEKQGARDDNSSEWIIAFADDEKEALSIADLYDVGKIEMDNVWCQTCGKAHIAAELK